MNAAPITQSCNIFSFSPLKLVLDTKILWFSGDNLIVILSLKPVVLFSAPRAAQICLKPRLSGNLKFILDYFSCKTVSEKKLIFKKHSDSRITEILSVTETCCRNLQWYIYIYNLYCYLFIYVCPVWHSQGNLTFDCIHLQVWQLLMNKKSLGYTDFRTDG